ncbi:MAG TPA: hypothetical protein DEF72_05010 [Gammaproteobacteria bacterium]|nr:hypothetical protein [Gammaproteobacteria bacterium]
MRRIFQLAEFFLVDVLTNWLPHKPVDNYLDKKLEHNSTPRDIYPQSFCSNFNQYIKVQFYHDFMEYLLVFF